SESKIYFSELAYDEIEFFAILKAAIHLTGYSKEKFLEGYGECFSKYFFEKYGSLLKKEWKTLDILEKLEEYNIHILSDGGNAGGKFICHRENKNKLTIVYQSPRQLCWGVQG